MKKRELLDVFGEIDDKFVDEAAPKNKVKKNGFRFTDLVACILILALALTPLAVHYISGFVSEIISAKNPYDPLAGKNIVESHIVTRENLLAAFIYDDTTFEAVNELSTGVVKCKIESIDHIFVYPSFVYFFYNATVEEVYLDVNGELSVGDSIIIKSTDALVGANEAFSLVDQPANATTYHFLDEGPYGENDYALYSWYNAIPIEVGVTYLAYLSDYNEEEGVYSEIGCSHLYAITDGGVYATPEFTKVYKNESELMKFVNEGLEERTGRVEEVGRDQYLDELSEKQATERRREKATILWVDNRKKKDRSITNRDARIVWHWSDMEDYECFSEIEYNGKKYYSRQMYLTDSSAIGPLIGTAKVSGFDYYTEVTHTVNCEIYEMKGVSSDQYIIVKIEGAEKYFAALAKSPEMPETLSDYINTLNPEAYMFITDVSHCNDSKILGRYKISGELVDELWTMIKQNGGTATKIDEQMGGNGEYVSFRVSSTEYGVRDRKLIVHSYGYIWTNVALDEGCSFKIGRSEAKKIINYVKDNFGESLPLIYSFSIAGTVTEIGEDYFLIDDSDMMADPSEGIVFNVSLQDKTIARYFDGPVKVGSFIVVEYDGHVSMSDGKYYIANPLSIVFNARFSDDPNERNPE